MQKPKSSLIISNIFLLLILFCFSACSVRAEQKSLTSQFDTVDALISQGQNADAVKLLKKTEKKAYDSWSYIGIYKRYNKIGETELSDKLLKKAIKKNEKNLELNAVYTSFLLHNDKLKEAEKIAVKLRGTRYGSLYSEVMLKTSLKSDFSTEQAKRDFFRREDFYNVYYEAYQGSKNPVWIRNCAVFQLSNGLYANAAALCPGIYADVDDAYFWALTLYDGSHFYESIAAADSALSFINDFSEKGVNNTSLVKLYSLQSDAYMAVADMESAEASRQKIIINIDNLKERKGDADILPLVFVNSAIYANNIENRDSCADLLFYTVNRWPDFVPALILYADFAYESSLERNEDSEMLALRNAGIKTLEMEKYDNRRKIPLSDALYRIDDCLSRTQDPFLYVEKLDIRYKTDKTLSEKDKLRDLWNLLENTYSEDEKYKTILIQYAISYLLNTKKEQEAFDLYNKYIYEHLSIDTKKDFWEQVALKVQQTDLGIAEAGAYFAVKNNRLNEAKRMYEYLVYESGGILEADEVSMYSTTPACMNLADIYFSYGTRAKALSLYGKAAGRESRNRIRSNIYYRIASVYVDDGDIKNALRSADYAVNIYPENERAVLLRTKLQK